MGPSRLRTDPLGARRHTGVSDHGRHRSVPRVMRLYSHWSRALPPEALGKTCRTRWHRPFRRGLMPVVLRLGCRESALEQTTRPAPGKVENPAISRAIAGLVMAFLGVETRQRVLSAVQ
jgi:hypothetical protein